MLSEKDLWDSLPDDLRKSLETILDRYQRHLMMLEVEVAELKNTLPQLHLLLNQQTGTTLSPPTVPTRLWQDEETEKS